MELSKQSLLNLHIFTDPLTKNFIAIQQEFKKVHQSIAQLKKENQSFRGLKDTHEKHGEIGNGQAPSQSARPRITKHSLTQKNHDQHDKTAKGHNESFDKKNQDPKFSQKSIPNLSQDQKRNTESIEFIASEHSINSGVLNDTSNTPQTSKPSSVIDSIKENRGPSSKQESSHPNTNGKKAVIIDTTQSHRNQTADTKSTTIQITIIKQRLEELEANELKVKEQIEKLQKENQKFSKMLGIKRPPKTEQLKTKKTLNMTRNDLASKKVIEGTQTEIKGEEMACQEDEQANDFGCFKELKDDIEKIRDYLSGKMRAIDTNFAEVNIKINGIERSLDILERTDNSLKEDIESLEKTANETKLNITELHEKSIHAPKTRRNRHNDTRMITEENDETQKDELDIEDRIINLLDEMERLKEEYNDILFGKSETDGKDKGGETDMAQKRKKLALKLNSNPVSDQKLRKDLSNCRRELKKLRQEFDYLMSGVNAGTNETKTFIIKPNETKEEWKSLSTKINKFKTELQSQIKELEGKITANNELTVVLNEFEVGIEECKILLKKKLDIVDFDKTTKRIENRLNNFIRQTFEKEGYTNEQDAILSKQPWFCLSCDVELKTYSGKMNKQNPAQTSTGEKFVGKKVNPESHMVRRNENGRLPSIGI